MKQDREPPSLFRDPGKPQRLCVDCRDPVPWDRKRCIRCFVRPQIEKRQKLINEGWDLPPIKVPGV
jgi:hypothetical protein